MLLLSSLLWGQNPVSNWNSPRYRCEVVRQRDKARVDFQRPRLMVMRCYRGESTTMRSMMLAICGCVAMSGFAFSAMAAETAYVTASSLNCREEARSDATIIAKLSQGTSVTVVDRQSAWANLDLGEESCWASARYLSSERLMSAAPFASTGYSGATSPRAPRKKAAGGGSYATSPYKSPGRSSAKRSRSGGTYGASSCPCSGSRVCIGPRGGRFCITSGGNKRYGV